MKPSGKLVKASIVTLQMSTIIISFTVLAALIVLPHFEGRNEDASLFQIYFTDPLLAYVYLGSIAFFVAMYHIIRYLQFAGRAKTSAELALYHLRCVRHSLLILLGFVIGFGILLSTVYRYPGEDITAGITMTVLAIIALTLFNAGAVVLDAVSTNQLSERAKA